MKSSSLESKSSSHAIQQNAITDSLLQPQQLKVVNLDHSDNMEKQNEEFLYRHIGPTVSDQQHMLNALGYKDLNSFTDAVVPQKIRLEQDLALDQFQQPLSETQALEKLQALARQNKVFRSYIGLGYYNCKVPAVIQRNILENPCWYTQYTPYQPEISQGRLEALLNFQTLICELTGLPVSNSSLLDEATAAAEAMSTALAVSNKQTAGAMQTGVFLIDSDTHPQTIAVVESRANALGVEVKRVDKQLLESANAAEKLQSQFSEAFGILLSYPGSSGKLVNYSQVIQAAKASAVTTILASDLLALCLLKSPGELGADIAIGNAQRFGVPLGYGGPAAAFIAVKDELKRLMPGRLVGVSRDATGQPAMRLALQTREQHIRREKATSNICTAQVLLANMSSMYAVYHGPQGLKKIASRVHSYAASLAEQLQQQGCTLFYENFFDTLLVKLPDASQRNSIESRCNAKEINLGWLSDSCVRVALDETVEPQDLTDLLFVITGQQSSKIDCHEIGAKNLGGLERKSDFLTQPVFNSYHSETEFLRYVRRLESKDLSLATAMIPLGSCTMKLNATSEMLPVSWAEFSSLHPFAPTEQAKGYAQMFTDLEQSLARITGFAATSLQPNAGSQGEYAGLLVIKAFLESKGQNQRNICLIPKSAHGTNPASAVMAGFKVVAVDCDSNGNIDLNSLAQKIDEHKDNLAVLMATYPSTHGVFESEIQKVCALVHEQGGQVYMDGANLNALVGLSSSSKVGADVVHINLHKTFCIPHGGGGPGMGPICVREHLAEFLPGHPLVICGGKNAIGPVSAAPYGSASILPIPWMYIAMMGARGLKQATQVAILSANYIAKRLSSFYPVLYTGPNGLVAHECIIDCRQLKASAGIEVEDIAKRLMDYGFHAPTISFPVPGTMMIEPTESESLKELDRFIEALIAIHAEVEQIKKGKYPRDNNPLKNAPHTAQMLAADNWDKPYSREVAAYPTAAQKSYKFWPAVARIDGAYGDRNLICTCSVSLN